MPISGKCFRLFSDYLTAMDDIELNSPIHTYTWRKRKNCR